MVNTKAFFNRAAPSWDKLTREDHENIVTMLRLSDLRPGMRMLDAGCGTGFLEPYLLQYQPERIYAVDYAENMIKIAKSKELDDRVEFICQDFYRLAPRRFASDFMIFYNAFPHFDDSKRLAAHIARLVLPRGRLTVSHTQGKHDTGEMLLPGLPAQGLINVLSAYFRLDVLVDNNAMLMVSGIRLDK